MGCPPGRHTAAAEAKFVRAGDRGRTGDLMLGKGTHLSRGARPTCSNAGDVLIQVPPVTATPSAEHGIARERLTFIDDDVTRFPRQAGARSSWWSSGSVPVADRRAAGASLGTHAGSRTTLLLVWMLLVGRDAQLNPEP